MSGGLVALLDDIAALAKMAAASLDDVGAAAGKATAKAAGVVVDDTAVTPRYVDGFSADRELPMIKKIAIGSLRNKLLIILPVAMLLSQFLPVAMSYLLIFGGCFLCFEGAEKVWEKLSGHEEAAEGGDEALPAKEREDKMVSSAIRTDLILSAEIMAISLASVASEPFVSRLMIMILVAFGITALVYGVVAAIVKMDDVGLHLAGRQSSGAQKLGRGMVKAMPKVMSVLSTVGIAAMIWVGGHIILTSLDHVGVHQPLHWVHTAEEAVADALHFAHGFIVWLTETLISAAFGLVVGAIIVAVMHVIPRKKAVAH